MNSESTIDFAFDKQHIWHPYTSMTQPISTFGVVSANGCELRLADGRQLIDGTSSWWACIHGYSNPYIVKAMEQQLHTLSHVMFGGITHAPAVELAKKLMNMTAKPLTKVFFSDSGSVAVEVSLKMALQYWQGQNKPQKQQILTVKRGYHGDTFAAMSVCDPDNGMHTMFGESVTSRLFAPAPQAKFDEALTEQDKTALRGILEQQHQDVAAIIIEPIMQGAGGMRFYSPEYLKLVRQLCDEFDVLLIIDEIATGFGRTGKLFAYEHANISPDLLCLGKALTGGYISLAATLCTDKVAKGISDSAAGVFMHGPTFMANPLACAAANASMELINQGNWQTQVAQIEQQLRNELQPAKVFASVKDVRVLGAVGIIEIHGAVNTAKLQQAFVDLGVWVRPFANFIYIMPPYIISSEQLSQLTQAMKKVVSGLEGKQMTADYISHG